MKKYRVIQYRKITVYPAFMRTEIIERETILKVFNYKIFAIFGRWLAARAIRKELIRRKIKTRFLYSPIQKVSTKIIKTKEGRLRIWDCEFYIEEF